MKTFLVALISLISYNAFAISFYTEEQVQQALHAQKVIEISKYSVQDKLVAQDSSCQKSTYSRSSRAFVVKKDNQSLLYVTTSEIADLELCGSI